MAGAEGEKADFHINAQKSRTRSSQSGLNNGKLGLPNPAAQPLNQLQPQTPKEKTEKPKTLGKCPQCSSTSLYKDGLRYISDGTSIQRWLCRNCGYRFTDPQRKAKTVWKNPPSGLNLPFGLLYSCQGNNDPKGRVPSAPEAVQTLAEVKKDAKNGQAGATMQTTAAKGKIIEYSFWLLKRGYAESTIKGRTKILKILTKREADLFDPESVKEAIAKQKWSEGRKANAVDAYTSFLQMHGMTWDPPKYKRIRKLPFIPTETEIDQLIAGCGKRTSTLLQLLKETGMRIGEAWKLEWTDIDSENGTVRVTPEKGSNPRIFKTSTKLMNMLNSLPKNPKSTKVFGWRWLKSQERLFVKERRKIAEKLQNQRILKITFHTFRHWKATMEYHKTKDILHVMQILGHKNINNTLMYTQLVNFKENEYVSKVAKTVKEACQLIEAGFEYVCEVNGAKIFRKRK